MSNPWDRYRDKRIVYQSALRAAKYGAQGSYTLEEWLGLCAQYDYRCALCSEKVPLTADHIVPLSRGGSNFISNIQPLCKPCNSHKHARIPSHLDNRQPIQLTLPEYSPNWGGKRPRAGRPKERYSLTLSLEAYNRLQVLTKQQPDKTEEDILSELIGAALQELV